MAFKETEQPKSVPDTPEKLFLDLPRRKHPAVQPHQKELMDNYVATAINLPDVAMQLPTGSGKTLAGLLIGEWRRRKYKERIVYLVPTKQLVNQVVDQANEKYGLSVNGFTGSSKDYNASERAEYKNADKIAVTTYSSLFNSSPFFNDAEIIILDDIHSAENYISELWSIKIDRLNPLHTTIHTSIANLLKPRLETLIYSRLIGEVDGIADRTWVDKLPTSEFSEIKDQLIEILDVSTKDTDLVYSWNMIKDHLHACHLYFSSQEILIRPLIPPTWTLPAFNNAKQRIYMSATLGEGGDLERLVGRTSIHRLPVPIGGVGRRFFIFPDMSLEEEEVKDLRINLMEKTERSLILVPSNKMRDEVISHVEEHGYSVFKSEDIETSKESFVSSSKATVVVANRYDGIDFPGDECRLLFVEGLPRAMNLQERFLMSRMGANALFNERIQTRVLQAIGRCTRGLEDYSAVVISGQELPDYLADKNRRKYFHPELQAELKFGIEQSQKTTNKDIVENLEVFLENGEKWEQVNQQIVESRKTVTQEPFPAMQDLKESVSHEVAYQMKLWQKDYESALIEADKVLSKLKDTNVRGYRALWHYLAGSSAYLAYKANGNKVFETRSKQEFGNAKECAVGIPWLVTLAGRYSDITMKEKDLEEEMVFEQIERIEEILTNLGTTHGRKYSRRESEIITGLDSRDSSNPKPFENAHKQLGEMLGFQSGKEESDGSPDPWWINSDNCIVFEDHSGALDGATIDVNKARQVSSHPDWIKKNVSISEKANIIPVLITPADKVKKGAVPHLNEVSIWRLSDFRKWANEALSTIREIRNTFSESGDLTWRESVAKILKDKKLDAPTIMKLLRSQKALDILKEVD